MKLAFMMDDAVDETEFVGPFRRLLDAGHDVVVVGPQAAAGAVARGARDVRRVELAASRARAAECELAGRGSDGRCAPAGSRGAAVEFVATIESAGRPVGAIGHSPWVLIEPCVERNHAVVPPVPG
jgi:protease I